MFNNVDDCFQKICQYNNVYVFMVKFLQILCLFFTGAFICSLAELCNFLLSEYLLRKDFFP